ncbi:MAG: lipase family protein [Alphaproteobacteria bacterium]|nr:lipase family protein [Alphaproteobacteria bacterium]
MSRDMLITPQTLALYARLSQLAYVQDETQLEERLFPLGFELLHTFDSVETGTQAYLAKSLETGAYELFARGTEADQLKDIKTDLDFRKRAMPTAPATWLHKGFYDASMSLFHQVSAAVPAAKRRDMKLSGHSLGGIIAQILAFQLGIGEEGFVVSYGAPRGGNQAFADLFVEDGIHNYRVVRQADPVPLLPPKGLGFTGAGIKIYIDVDLQLRQNPPFYSEAALRLVSLLDKGLNWREAIADHDIEKYATDLETIARG